MQAHTHYTHQGLLQFQQVAAKRVSPRYYSWLRAGYLVAGAGAMSLGLWFAAALARGDRDPISVVLALIGLYLGAQLLWMGARFYDFFARRALRRLPPQARELYWSFEPEQMVISNRLRNTAHAYDQIGAVCETDGYFLFYFSDRNGYVLNQSDLQSGQTQALRMLLNERLTVPVVDLRIVDGNRKVW